MVVLACSVALSAQVAQPDASAKLKQFERNLANAMKVRSGAVSLVTRPQAIAAPDRVCAIPLLRVGPDATFQSQMPVIAPDSKAKFSIREVMPPAPSCDEQGKR
jgi:hypothetical protein